MLHVNHSCLDTDRYFPYKVYAYIVKPYSVHFSLKSFMKKLSHIKTFITLYTNDI